MSSFAQMTVSQTGTVTQWVQNVLTGPGVTVSNVTYTGDMQSIGTFTTGTNPTIVGFNSGMVLSSGNVSHIPWPNTSSTISTQTSGGSDPQLAGLITQAIKDAAVLEFDFIPLSDTIKFRYVFASEEYTTYVNSINDVFGFFVTGLSPLGGNYTNKNIALIPNTTSPVSINSINNGNSNTGPCVNCTYYNHNYGTTVAFNATTTVMTAWLRVIPCFSYHIKIAIGDASDKILDSGVFLEANSFTSSNVQVTQVLSNALDTMASEGCTDAILNFSIPYAKSIPYPVYYYLSGTATNGVDYTAIQSPIIIPAGQTSASLTIHPIVDGITEPIESIIAIVNTSPCTSDSVLAYISDNDSLSAYVANDTILCNNSSDTLFAKAFGMKGPYSYNWSNGDTTDYLVVQPNTHTVYTVTVTDQCQTDTVVEANVWTGDPQFTLVADSVCRGEVGTAWVETIELLDYEWSTGDLTDTIKVSPQSTHSYSCIATDTLGCQNEDSVLVYIYPAPVADITDDLSVCVGQKTTLSASGGIHYVWSTGDSTQQISVAPTQTQMYYVTVYGDGNCNSFEEVEVSMISTPTAEITSDVDTVCKGGTAILTASGGQVYVWNTGETSESIIVSPVGSQQYTLLAANTEAGVSCFDTAYYDLYVKRCNRIYIPSAFTPNGDGLNDEFGAFGKFKNIDNYQMYIYDRWGKLVFKSKDPNKRWNGKVEGEKPTTGVYTYIIQITESFTEPYELRGTLTLL